MTTKKYLIRTPISSLILGMKYLLLIISLSFLSVGCGSRYTFEQKSGMIYRYDGWTGDVHRKTIHANAKEWQKINK